MIVGGALRIIDADRLDALTMRRLGAQLGCDPMAIYHHVSDKAALLHEVVRAVFSRMDLNVDPSARWRDRVDAWARAYRDLIRAHPYLVLQITSDAVITGTAMTTASEPLYVALSEAGFSPILVAYTADTLVDFLNGHGLGYAHSQPGSATQTHSEDPLNHTSTPVLSSVLREAAGHRNSEAGFVAGLDIILEGALALNAAGYRPK